MIESPYTDADLIQGLYLDPANETLLAEYALQTGGVQLGIFSSSMGQSNPTDMGTIGGSGGIGPLCFTGDTLFTLFNGDRIPMSELYESREHFIGKGAKSFTDQNAIVPGEIAEVFKSRATELLHVMFAGESEPMRMKPMHRFWTRKGFVAMRDIGHGELVWGCVEHEFRLRAVKSKRLVIYKGGIDTYNARISNYACYMASAVGGIEKAVSNAKFPRDEDIP